MLDELKIDEQCLTAAIQVQSIADKIMKEFNITETEDKRLTQLVAEAFYIGFNLGIEVTYDNLVDELGEVSSLTNDVKDIINDHKPTGE